MTIIVDISRGFVIAIVIVLIAVLIYFKNNDLKAREYAPKIDTYKGTKIQRQPNKEFEGAIKAQYERLSRETVTFYRTEWQIATIAFTVTSGVLVVGLTYIHNPYVSGLVILGGSFLDFALTVAIAKNHQLARMQGAFIRKIDEEYGLEPVPENTDEILEFFKKQQNGEHGKKRLLEKGVDKLQVFLDRRSLGDILAIGLLIISLGLLVLSLLIISTGSIL